jgi:hypothetical protein
MASFVIQGTVTPRRPKASTTGYATVTPVDDPALGERTTLTGRVVDIDGSSVAAHLPVVIRGAPADDADAPLAPIIVTENQTSAC